MAELTYDMANVYYVDPADALTVIDSSSEQPVYVTPNQEDLCIAVDLEVDCPKRFHKAVAGNQSKFVLQWETQGANSAGDHAVNFLGGTKFTNNTTLRYLTTDGTEYVYGSETTPEMFGIKSIYIDYSTFFIPNITIEFADVRGASLFSIEESAHENCVDGIPFSVNYGDVTRSFFECFFRFPYPTFKLKVKGLYGEPISYELTVAKCNHVFDASTGNYNVTANMVGYTYSFMNDVTMNMLMAAPDAPVWGNGYWESNFAHKDLPNGEGTFCKFKEIADRLANVPAKINEQKRKMEETKEKYDDALNNLIEIKKAATKNADELIANYASHYMLLDDGETTVYPDKDMHMLFNIRTHTSEDAFKYIRTDASGNYENTSGTTYDNEAEEIQLNGKAIQENLKEYGERIAADSDLSTLTLPADGITSFTNDGIAKRYTCYVLDWGDGQELTFTDENVRNKVTELIQKSSAIATQIKFKYTRISVTTPEVIHKLKNQSIPTQAFADFPKIPEYKRIRLKEVDIHVVDYGSFIEKVNQLITALQTSRDVSTDDTDLSELYKDALGFKPTIENVTAIIVAHLETLLACIKSCENDVFDKTESGKRRVSSLTGGSSVESITTDMDEDVPPFPEVYTINKGKKTRSWLGINGVDTENAPEVTLIEALIEAIEATGRSIDDAKNKFETEVENTASTNGATSLNNVVVPLPIAVNDFISVRPSGSDKPDNDFSPFGYSISSAIDKSQKIEVLLSLLKLLRIRWINIGSCSKGDDGTNLGKIDAENFMAMHSGEIRSMEQFSSILDTYRDDLLGSVNNLKDIAYKTSDSQTVELVPNVGYKVGDTQRDAANVSNKKLIGDKYYRYNLYEKDEKLNIKRQFYMYSDYAAYAKTVVDACTKLNITSIPDFLKVPTVSYSNKSLVEKLGTPDNDLIYKPFGNFEFNDTTNGVATNPYDDNKVYVYKRSESRFVKGADSKDGAITVTLDDINTKIITRFDVFGDCNYYSATTVDARAILFLDEVAGIFKAYNNRATDCEYVEILSYAQLLRDGCWLLQKVGENNAGCKSVIDEYKKWRDSVFVPKIDNVYSLKTANGKRITSVELSTIIQLVHGSGERLTVGRVAQHTGYEYQSFDATSYYYDIKDVSGLTINQASFSSVYEKMVASYGGYSETHNSKTETGGADETHLRLYNKNTQGLREICSTLLTPVIVFSQDRLCSNKVSINDEKCLSSYVRGFISECKAYADRNKEEFDKAVRDANIASLNNSLNTDIEEDIRIAMYIYLKTLYDKWLCGNYDPTYGFDYYKRYGYKNLFEGHFHFIDSFYNKIGDELIIDVQHLIDEMYNSQTNQAMSLMEFITSVASKNSVQTLCVQNFLDFSKGSDGEGNVLRRAFYPIAYNDSNIHNINSIPDFVFVYANQPSQHIDIGDEGYGYEDDGFHLSCMDALHDVCVSEKRLCKIPAFGVKYGSLYQNYFKDIQVGMDSSMATEQSTVALFALANANNDADGNVLKNPVGQDLYTVYSNNSYTCKFNMMGSAWIQPLMYFDLQNVPMFHGAYMIKKVTHRLTPGNMVTEVTGVRQAKVANKLIDRFMRARKGTYAEENRKYQAERAKVENDCPYLFFDPTAQDVAQPDANHSTNIQTLKLTKTTHEGTEFSYYDIVLNEVFGFANSCGLLNDTDVNLEMTIKLLTSVLFCRIKWYNKNSGGWNNILKDGKFAFKFTPFDSTSLTEERYNQCVKWIEEILSKNPGILGGQTTTVNASEAAPMKHGNKTETGKSAQIPIDDLGELCNYRKATSTIPSSVKVFEYFQHRNIIFGSGYQCDKSEYARNVLYEVGSDNSTIALSQTSISNRTPEEEKFNDLSVGLLRSIKKTCDATTTLDYSKFTITGGADEIKFKCSDQEQLYQMFDMLLNTYYDYIYQLFIDVVNNNYIYVATNDQTKGMVRKRFVGAIKNTSNQFEFLQWGNVSTYPEKFRKSMYKKYLYGTSGDTILKKVKASFMKTEAFNFSENTDSHSAELDTYFKDIRLEKCDALSADEYNKEEKQGSVVIRSGMITGTKGVSYRQASCIKTNEHVIHKAFGGVLPNTQKEVEDHLVPVSFKVWDKSGDSVSITRKFNSGYASDFLSAMNEVYNLPENKRYYIDPKSFGTYCFRNVSGTTNASIHAYGLAFDVNPFGAGNPYPRGSQPRVYNKYKEQYDKRTQLRSWDDEFVKIMRKHGFGWGIYNNGCDYMHFSVCTTTGTGWRAGQLIGA